MTPEQFSEAAQSTRQKLLDTLRGGVLSKAVDPPVAIMACLMLAAEMTHLLGKHSSNAFCRVARDVFHGAAKTVKDAVAKTGAKA